MQKNKMFIRKAIALFASISLAICLTQPVFATDSESIVMEDPDPDDPVSAEGSIEATGSIKTITIKCPHIVISIVVPTLYDESYDFVLDPNCLISSFYDVGGAEESSKSLLFKSKDPEKVYSLYSDIAGVINKSTVPLKLTVELRVENKTGEEILFSSPEDVNSDDVPSMGFAIIPTETCEIADEEFVEEGTPLEEEMAVTDEEGYAYKEIIIPGSTDNFDVVTNPTDDPDFFIQEYVAKEDCTWFATGFVISGACNENADWDAVSESLANGGSLTFTLTYKVVPLTEEESAED